MVIGTKTCITLPTSNSSLDALCIYGLYCSMHITYEIQTAFKIEWKEHCKWASSINNSNNNNNDHGSLSFELVVIRILPRCTNDCDFLLLLSSRNFHTIVILCPLCVIGCSRCSLTPSQTNYNKCSIILFFFDT